ncbi:MAG: hypothetical protein GYA17_09765 [Chloroflexi bacterium]|nr:hypothetical protein [Chloroflexota bacterium]
MATIGVDCDVALFHSQVDGGEPYGFLLEPRKDWGPVVSIHREAYANALGAMEDVTHLWFTVLLADDLLNPDGSRHSATAASMYSRLVQILLQHSDIGLMYRSGILTGLTSGGHIMIETIYPAAATVTVQLSSRGGYFAPPPTGVYLDSKWVDEDSYTGERNWGNSYWR